MTRTSLVPYARRRWGRLRQGAAGDLPTTTSVRIPAGGPPGRRC
ncbi:hypothetical protein [Streptomyces sp. NPDC058653]